jgi:hypothetical protein
MDSAVVFSILLEERGGVGLAVAAKKCFFGDDGVLIGIIFFSPNKSARSQRSIMWIAITV